MVAMAQRAGRKTLRDIVDKFTAQVYRLYQP